ncbi:hypothetical protein JCM17846_16500 [Iodidimonas nitroreducens]|uniref:RNA polymerase sigma factor 70 region 1.1 domain-containing protein n=1 Tax=Iodidimonas nitroreducens TaxID=1236968 RepID=A0A5A7N789_9PROT|nr:RNA polymerase sigma factor region1.1 domain-containing protein [Iodidimonas nitroreducens]GER03968.1 hypothetical protein JCM17846_16500 [Iodidimonas nitroreducens]
MASSPDAHDAIDAREDGDSPILDMSEASVKKMISRARERGYISYDEINKALPSDEISSEKIEDIMSLLSEMGINVIEGDEPEEDGDSDQEPILTTKKKTPDSRAPAAEDDDDEDDDDGDEEEASRFRQ